MASAKKVLNFDLPSPVLEMLNSLTAENIDETWLFFDSGSLDAIFQVLSERFPVKCRELEG